VRETLRRNSSPETLNSRQLLRLRLGSFQCQQRLRRSQRSRHSQRSQRCLRSRPSCRLCGADDGAWPSQNRSG
jgi:hypothetical protein